MARHTLIEINMNDELPNVIRKCNDNFRRVSSQQSRSTDTAIMNESERSDEALADAVQSVNEAISGLSDKIDQLSEETEKAIADLRAWVSDEIAKATRPESFAPPIGCYLFSETNPEITWPGTKWERQQEALWLVSAGTSGPYAPGTKLGKDFVKLDIVSIPEHFHGMEHWHNMVHTHTMKNHTHGLSGAVAKAAGKHRHYSIASHSYVISATRDTQNADIYNGSLSGSGYKVPRFPDTTGLSSSQYLTDYEGYHEHSLSGVTNAPNDNRTDDSSASRTDNASRAETDPKGGNQAHENRPPSLCVPLWKRTA